MDALHPHDPGNAVAEKILDISFSLHRQYGPGLLESAYERLLAYELQKAGMYVESQKILPIHEAQILTYLKLSKIRLGLILNFHSKLLKDGLKRFVL